jgi:hypothetical protein
MHRNMMRALAGVGVVAAVLLAGAPSWAAGVPSGGTGGMTVSPPQPAPGAPAGINFGSTAPLTATQRMTDRVDSMSRQVLQDEAAIHAGEDFLGSGTSMTH